MAGLLPGKELLLTPPPEQEDGRAQIPSGGCEGKEDLSP